jgi:hypothetical protein
MIDAVDLVFLRYLSRQALSARAEARSWPKGFSTIRRRKPFAIGVHQPAFAQLAGDGGEETVGHRHVEQHIAVQRLFLVQLASRSLRR